MTNNSKELFEYYRFFLTPIEEPELPFCQQKTREEVIDDMFSPDKTYKFRSREKDYCLYIKQKEGSYVFANIGKRVKKNIRTAPEEGFKTREIEDWPGCDIFINLSNEHNSGETAKKGQLLLVQVNNVDMKYRASVLQNLASAINRDIQKYGFFLTINSIPSEKTLFWNVVKENEGKIKKITFSYIPPNLLDLKSSLENDLRSVAGEFNSTKVQISMENTDGNLTLSENNKLLKESAEYVDLGAGTFKLQFKGNKKKAISSNDTIKTESFVDTDITLRGQNLTKEQLTGIMNILLRK
ncbi:MAG: hypothetical protein IJ019_03300 [Alphaproteobacteria bacterium]|nr:hypothetical protein [Alphaproteobacteria bacterium]